MTAKKKTSRTSVPVKSFTAEEICAIIKQCGESDVLKLSLGDFHVEFERKASALLDTPEQASQVFPVISQEQSNEIQDLANIKERSDDASEEIANLLLTNPVEYEDSLMRGDLEDAES